MYKTEGLIEDITGHILRVSALRERSLREAQAAGDVGSIRVKLSLMDQAMHFAKRSRVEMCPVAMLAWRRALEDFK